MAISRVIVDATGASNGVVLSQLLSRGMSPVVQVDATGTETASGATLDQLRARGIAAFCQIDQTGVDPVSGVTVQQLAQRGILGLCPVDSSGIAQNGTLTVDQIQQRGLKPFLPTDETGAAKTIGGIILSNRSIAENSANGSAVGTASLPASYTGVAVWAITDGTGTFQINSSTGVITVLSNTALNYEVNTSLPITISVSGVTPAAPNLNVSIIITNVIEIPANTVAPVIAGSASIGSVLTVTSFGTWTDMQAGSFALQWNNGADIVGATAASYTVQSGDSGLNIICKVTATNSAGNATANSNSIGPIGSAPTYVPTYELLGF